MYPSIILRRSTFCLTRQSEYLFLKVYFKESIITCSRSSYKIVPLTILNKYLHNDISETELDINISVNKNSEKFLKIVATSVYLQTPKSHLKLRLRSIIGF